MADIRLVKPAAGTSQTISCEAGSRFIFDFPTDAAMLSRSGDNMVMTFEDGSTILLENFYTAFHKENMPTFEVEGAEISGEDFFMAMNEPDLMPAAGPTRVVGSDGNGNRFHDFLNTALLDGLDRLGGLDIGWADGNVFPDTDGAATAYVDIDYPVTVTPSDPGAGSAKLTVYESGLESGSEAGNKPTTAEGSLNITAPDGVASIVIGGVTVLENGLLTGNSVFTDEGTLTVTGFDAVTGELKFVYELNNSTQEHDTVGKDSVSHDLAVTVTDTDGSSADSTITVTVVDDVPTISSFEAEVMEGTRQAVVGNVLEGAVAGADGADFAWDAKQDGKYGEITLNSNGTYSYELNNDLPEVKALTAGQTLTEEFTYTYTDEDGDIATGSVIITIKGDGAIPVVTLPEVDEGNAHIMVDEGALSDGSGQHTEHKASGNDSFIVNLNGEDGTIELAFGDQNSVTLNVENGKFLLPQNTSITVNGVVVTVTGAERNSDGSWKVNYKYELAGEQSHQKPGVTGEDDRLSNFITITVEDATGDTASGSLTVEVHDDGPAVVGKIDFHPHNDQGFFYDKEGAIQFSLSGDNAATKLEDINFGADVSNNPAIVTVTVNNEEFTVEVTRGEDGTLYFSGEHGNTINFTSSTSTGGALSYDKTTGNFIYTRPAGDVGGGSNRYDFTLTVTDNDGDTVSTDVYTVETTTVPTVTVDDPDIMVDEGALSDGSGQHTEHKASGNDSFTVNLNGEDGTIELTFGEQKITLSVEDGKTFDTSGVPTIRVNGVDVTITSVSQLEKGGDWTVQYDYKLTGEQQHNNSHSSDYHNDELLGSIDITVTDTAGDTATGYLNVEVHDDGPSVHANSSVEFERGEAGGKKGITGLDKLFSIKGGADGEAEADREYGLHLKDGETSLPSDVKVLLNGYDEPFDVTLVQNGDVIVGQIMVEGELQNAFTISLEPWNDSFRLSYAPEKNVTLYHVDKDGHHVDTVNISGVQLGVTVTDKDGDTASDYADINIKITDNELKLTNPHDVTFTLDEGDPAAGNASSGRVDSHAQSLENIFKGVKVSGAEGGVVSTTYELRLQNEQGGDFANPAGCTALINGEEYSVYLVMTENGDIAGRAYGIDGSPITIDGKPVDVFTVTLEDGNVVTRLNDYAGVSIKHNGTNETSVEDTITVSGVSVVMTVTDKEGETAESVADVNINIGDDEPAIAVTDKTMTLYDNGTSQTSKISSIFTTMDAGADGEASRSYNFKFAETYTAGESTGCRIIIDGTSYDLSLVLGEDGQSVMGMANGVTVFSLIITTNKSGDPAIKLSWEDGVNATFDHSSGTDASGKGVLEGYIKLEATLTDKDGDTATSTADIDLNFGDDVPDVTASVEAVNLGVEEADTPVSGSVDVSSLFNVDAGADGEGGRSYALTLESNAGEGLIAFVDGQQYKVELSLDDGVIHGTAGDKDIFTVSVDTTGKVTLTMTGAGTLKHDGSADLVLEGIGVSVTVTDNDGDMDSDHIDINIKITDSELELTNPHDVTFTLDEGDPAAGNASSGRVDSHAQSLEIIFKGVKVSGAEGGVVSTTYELRLQNEQGGDLANPAGCTALINGEEYSVYLVMTENGDIAGRAYDIDGSPIAIDGKPVDVFTVTLEDGKVVTRLNDYAGVSIKHNGTNETSGEDTITVSGVSVVMTVTDKEGETAESVADVNINIGDDEPAIAVTDKTMTLYDNGTSQTSKISSIFTTMDAGADGEASRSYNFKFAETYTAGESTGCRIIIDGTSYDLSLVLGEDGQSVMGMANGVTVFSLIITTNKSGEPAIKFSWEDGVNATFDHSSGTDASGKGVLEGYIKLEATLTDKDGDTATSTADIDLNFGDDAPMASPDSGAVTEGQTESASGNVVSNDTVGADGFGRVEWGGPVQGSMYELDGTAVKLDGEIVGTLTRDSAGNYTFTLDPDCNVPQNGLPDLVLSYTVYDKDGDFAGSTLTITIAGDKNIPTLPDIDSETPGAQIDTVMVDEGALSDGSGQHTEHGASGSDSFTVNLNGEDGTIKLACGNQTVELAVTKGEFVLPEKTVITVNGVVVTVTDAERNADGSWNINYRYELTGDQEHGNPGKTGEADKLSDSIAITVTDATGDKASGTLTVEVHDDGPRIEAAVGATEGTPDSGNLVSTGNGFDFVVTDASGTHYYYNNASGGTEVSSTILQGVWGDKVTISAGRVQYAGTGDSIHIDSFISGNGTIRYSNYINEHSNKNEDWGIFVDSNIDGNTTGGGGEYETNANSVNNTSEAIVIDLGGQLAYGITIDFGAFYYTFTNDGQEEGQEFALISFYKDGELITQRIVESDAATNGTATVTVSNEFLADGFDKVVISALWNDWDTGKSGQPSTFTIQGLDFVTAPDPLYVTEGTISVAPGADGYYAVPDSTGGTGEHTDDDFTLANVRFDMPETLEIYLDGSENPVSVTLTVEMDDSGNSRLTAVAGTEQIFSATLEKEEDGSYSWKMEQYKEFTVDDGKGGHSDSFQLSFVTKDGDGDIFTDSVAVPLNTTVVESPDNGEDITITSDIDTAGLIVTGEGGDTSVVTEGVASESTNYNICFLLDISDSMDAAIGDQSRYSIAVDSIEQYINSIITNENYVGNVNIAIIPFHEKALAPITVCIERILTADGSIQTQINGNPWSGDWTFTCPNMNSGTNYAEAFEAASSWYNGLGATATEGNVENLTYFLTDGFPNKSSSSNAFEAAEDALKNFNTLVGNQDLSVKVHAIGIGGGGNDDVLTSEAMESLSLFDNTGASENNPGIIWHNTDGSRAFIIAPDVENVDSYKEFKAFLNKHGETNVDYFIHVYKDNNELQDCYYKLVQNEKGDWGFWVYQDSSNSKQWASYDGEKWIYTYIKDGELENTTLHVISNEWIVTATPEPSGESEKITSAGELNSALAGGLTLVPAFEALTDNTILASESDSAVNIIYGDVMNTDALVAGNSDKGAEIGLGYDNFEKLGWTAEQIARYVHNNAVAMGRETLIVDKGDGQYDTYYRDVYGDIYKLGSDNPLDDAELKELSFIGREGGNDTVYGTQANDTVFGQEGNDLLFGDGKNLSLSTENADADTLAQSIEILAPDVDHTQSSAFENFIKSVEGNESDGNDQLFGGSGNDVIFGMGGDDYIVGGAGEDMLFGGAGNDIIVYDGDDYLVDGGSGIDIMVGGKDTPTLGDLLQGGENKPIVHDVEVLITGDNALDLTSMDDLGKYGITVGRDGNTDTLTLSEAWTHKDGTEEGTYYNAEAGLTLETTITPQDDGAEAAIQQQVLILQTSNS